jgi:hypothetical protein
MMFIAVTKFSTRIRLRLGKKNGILTFLKDVKIYRVIQEELPPLIELNYEDILSKKCHINLGPNLNIYRVTFIRNWKRTTVNCASTSLT